MIKALLEMGPFRALFICSIFTLGVLTACQSTSVVGPVTQELAKENYLNYTITWSGTFQGSKTKLFFKGYNKEGKVAVCGYYIKSSGSEERLTATWIEQAKIFLGDTEIVSTRFINGVEEGDRPLANCVTTTIPYSRSLMEKDFSLRGQEIHIYD
ncbi:MAG: hypothetical protein NXI13_02305 [Proteobacteria bacterium]|nr:hypothetical protein [Pseudomonadota bacterium]